MKWATNVFCESTARDLSVIGVCAADVAASGVVIVQSSTGNGLFYEVVGCPISGELTQR